MFQALCEDKAPVLVVREKAGAVLGVTPDGARFFRTYACRKTTFPSSTIPAPAT